MTTYQAPLRDIDFVLNELLQADKHYQDLGLADEVSRDLRDAVLAEAGRFANEVVAPLNPIGDQQGCTRGEQGVTTPEGFKEAYQQYIDGGWAGLSMPEEFGGQQLPKSMDMVVGEMLSSANYAWHMYPGLSGGCRETLLAHGTEEQRAMFLPKLISGEWTGTMCLTEPQGGSDLSFLKTTAKVTEDGRYRITGNKMFISSGEHDMAENIIHIVLARLPEAPAGTRGLSLFLVPRYLPTADGQVGEANAVSCGALEEKMGIHGNATCVMNFDGAEGYLIGEPHKGLRCMFTFMNAARVGTAMQGLCHAEFALQGALNYALEREAGRSLTGIKSPDRPADLLIVHPDVRRMLATIRAFAEGSRAFSHYLGQLIDREHNQQDANQKQVQNLLALLTPIAKGFLTEIGLEAASLGVQVYGGHGYIREWGMEQNMRDSRISTLYEGTTGIQALDLLGRKIMGSQGQLLSEFLAIVGADCAEMDAEFAEPLLALLEEWGALTQGISANAASNMDQMGSAASDYLMYSGYIVLAWMWGRMGTLAATKVSDSEGAFYRVKLNTARFYFQKILPRTVAHKAIISSGADVLMDLAEDDLRILAGK